MDSQQRLELRNRIKFLIGAIDKENYWHRTRIDYFEKELQEAYAKCPHARIKTQPSLYPGEPTVKTCQDCGQVVEGKPKSEPGREQPLTESS